jgi:hypothetical protein
VADVRATRAMGDDDERQRMTVHQSIRRDGLMEGAD